MYEMIQVVPGAPFRVDVVYVLFNTKVLSPVVDGLFRWRLLQTAKVYF